MSEPLHFTFQVGTQRITVRVEESEGGRAASAAGAFREIEDAILQAATATPTTTKALARAAGYKLNSYFRAAVARLVKAGRLVRVTGGVALPPVSGRGH